MPKVLMVTGDAAETLEVFYPYQRLLEAGYEVDIAAPEKRRLQIDVELGGGTFENGAGIVDGNLVSGRAWPDNAAWMREFMIVLEASRGLAGAGEQTGAQPADTWSEAPRARGRAGASAQPEPAGGYDTQPIERDRAEN